MMWSRLDPVICIYTTSAVSLSLLTTGRLLSHIYIHSLQSPYSHPIATMPPSPSAESKMRATESYVSSRLPPPSTKNIWPLRDTDNMADTDFIYGHASEPEREDWGNLGKTAEGARIREDWRLLRETRQSAHSLIERVAKRIHDEGMSMNTAASQQQTTDGDPTAHTPSHNPDQDSKRIDPPNSTARGDQN